MMLINCITCLNPFTHSRPAGRQPIYCRECRKNRIKEMQLEWVSSNSERVKTTQRDWRARNPERLKICKRDWASKNSERIKSNQRSWSVKNSERVNAKRKDWEIRNPEKVRLRRQRFLNGNSESVRQYRLARLIRQRIRGALKNNSKGSSSLRLLGMEIREYRIYLQGQFRDGMSWDNQGTVWHIDHIRPCAKFDLMDHEQQKDCFNWSNTQPLLVKENLKKSDK